MGKNWIVGNLVLYMWACEGREIPVLRKISEISRFPRISEFPGLSVPQVTYDRCQV